MNFSKLQEKELDMLKAVTDLCDQYGLTYTLYCGTLLGAVRHKGFIPWDDDVDLAMPLKDYRKFLALGDKLPEPYVLQYPGSTKGYNLNWAKVYADGTTYMDKRLIGTGRTDFLMHQGISMDIYPMIGAAGTKLGQKIQRELLLISRGMMVTEFNRAIDYVDVYKKRHRLVALIPYAARKRVGRICLKAAMLDPDKCEMRGTIDAAPFMGKYQYDDWRDLKKAAFGEWEFMIPRRYDKLLTRMYGDYMALPPEEERTGHFGEHEMIIDTERDYRDYQEAAR